MGLATSGIIRAEGVRVTSAQNTDLVVIQRVDTTTNQYTPRTITAQNLVETMPLGLTSGAVVFGGASGQIAQDPTNFAYNSGTAVLTVTSGVTVTAGPVALTNGNITLGTAGNGIQIKEGTNATMGTGTLSSGAATINTTKVTSSSRIFISDQGGTVTNLGSLYEDNASRVAGTSFTIKSSNILDSSNFVWLILEPS